ncbi:RNA polymerase sigma-70 factor (ECF subfamily) [Kordia periserrulae]|uniref:RNA polymerase sigma-70 factor (ECF subfamily) n=1 Tax=Kordia periserrulae TaxID=701523 RepID=A0A2T6BR46_9FLAO|nr:RNA polymerase sigma factor [Kordia periserrulae]PTX58526.1 RNA polymerase sigma-70 factor (ECF subfamily) [Kordia periserrulae]
MKHTDQDLLLDALNGNINAFQSLFAEFQPQLKSYLYRLLANRNDAEDITHDTFIKAYDNLKTFKGEASLKTWVFQIATSITYNYLKRRKRWVPNVSEQAKNLVLSNADLAGRIVKVAQTSEYGKYEIKEHIDTCFTCISKNLPIENQIALILKDIYDFSVNDICMILEKSEGTVKYLLKNARGLMTDIFDNRCALVNKNGACNQCSELNGWFNPKQNQQEALLKLDLVKKSKKYNREELFKLRTTLVKAIDPLKSDGFELQEILLKCNQMAMGEIQRE